MNNRDPHQELFFVPSSQLEKPNREIAMRAVMSETQDYIKLRLGELKNLKNNNKGQDDIFESILKIILEEKTFNEQHETIFKKICAPHLSSPDAWKIVFLMHIYAQAQKCLNSNTGYEQLDRKVKEAKDHLNKNSNNYSEFFAAAPKKYPFTLDIIELWSEQGISPSVGFPSPASAYQKRFPHRQQEAHTRIQQLKQKMQEEQAVEEKLTPEEETKKEIKNLQIQLYQSLDLLTAPGNVSDKTKIAPKIAEVFSKLNLLKKNKDAEFKTDPEVQKIYHKLSEEAAKLIHYMASPDTAPNDYSDAGLIVSNIVKSFEVCGFPMDGLIDECMAQLKETPERNAEILFSLFRSYSVANKENNENQKNLVLKLLNQAGFNSEEHKPELPYLAFKLLTSKIPSQLLGQNELKKLKDKVRQLSSDEIKKLHAEERVAFLNHFSSWDEVRAFLGGELFNDALFKERASAFSHELGRLNEKLKYSGYELKSDEIIKQEIQENPDSLINKASPDAIIAILKKEDIVRYLADNVFFAERVANVVREDVDQVNYLSRLLEKLRGKITLRQLEEIASTLKAINREAYNVLLREALVLFPENYDKAWFDTLKERNSDFLSWIMLTRENVVSKMTDADINNHLNQLNMGDLSPDQIKRLDKRVRMAWLNNNKSWKEAKDILGNDLLKKKAEALSYGFGEDEIIALSASGSETGLIVSFKEGTLLSPGTVGLIIGLLQPVNNEDASTIKTKRKIAWQLLEELDKGCLEDQGNLKEVVNEAGNAVIGRSYRHHLVELGFYQHEIGDDYQIDVNNKFVQDDIKNSPADASRDAGLKAIKQMLGDSRIVFELSEKKSFRDQVLNGVDAAVDITANAIANEVASRVNVIRSVIGSKEMQVKPQESVERTCLGQLVERGGQQGLTFADLNTAYDLVSDEKQENISKKLLKELPRFFKEYKGSDKYDEELEKAIQLVKQYLDLKYSEDEIIEKIKERMGEENLDKNIRALFAKLVFSDPRLTKNYLEKRGDPTPWPLALAKGFVAILAVGTFYSAIKNIASIFNFNPLRLLQQKKEQANNIFSLSSIALAVAAIGSLTPVSAAVLIGVAIVGAIGLGITAYSAYTCGREIIADALGTVDEARSVYRFITEGCATNHEMIEDILKDKDASRKLAQNILFCQSYGFDIRDNKDIPAKMKSRLVSLSDRYYWDTYPRWAVFIVNVVLTLSLVGIIRAPWYIGWNMPNLVESKESDASLSSPKPEAEDNTRGSFSKLMFRFGLKKEPVEKPHSARRAEPPAEFFDLFGRKPKANQSKPPQGDQPSEAQRDLHVSLTKSSPTKSSPTKSSPGDA
jgi:hypothetical protein